MGWFKKIPEAAEEDLGGGVQPDGSWDSSKCTHGPAFGRTWMTRGKIEVEMCNGCGRATGKTRNLA